MDRIAVFSNMYPSKEHPTFGIFVKNQVELLQEAQVNVDVIAIDNPKKGKMTTIQKYLSWFFRSFFYMAKHHKKLSLTHAHYAFPTGLISLYGKKLWKIPYVVTVHGGDIDKMANKNARIANLTSQILQEADRVIVVGERLKDNVMNQFGVTESNVEVMSMGVNTKIFYPMPKQQAKQKIGLQKKSNILFVGNVIEAKGLHELVEAFGLIKKDHADVSLSIIGAERDANFSAKLRKTIDSLKIEDVQFIGPKSQQELAEWMAASDVLALPSYHEGFGLVALEAMATGARVVGSDVGGLSYLLKDNAGIVVEPKSIPSLKDGLEESLKNQTAKISETVMQERVAEHSFDNILQRLLKNYESVQKG